MENLKELTKIAPGVLDNIRNGLSVKNEVKAEYKDGKIVLSFKPNQTWKKERAVREPNSKKWMTDGTFTKVLIASNRYGGGMHVKLSNGQTAIIKIDAVLVDEQARISGNVPADVFESVQG